MEAHTFNPCRGRKIAEYEASLDNTEKATEMASWVQHFLLLCNPLI